MKTAAYRVREVLRGHSAAASIIAVDTEGREVRLEVGALEGASIGVDEVLILSWATVQVPQSVAPSEGRLEDEPLLGRMIADLEAPADEAATDDEELRTVEDELKEIKALIGLD
jgi:hypothetical protein